MKNALITSAFILLSLLIFNSNSLGQEIIYSHEADTNDDGNISTNELTNYIGLWFTNSTRYPMGEVMKAVEVWTGRIPFCGNGIIETNETEQTCCEDVGCLGDTVCQNHTCVIINESEIDREVDIFIDEDTYSNLFSEIIRLKNDIESDFGKVVIYHNDFDDPKEIRDKIKNDYLAHGIKGIILIGDIPHVYYADALSDFYYMDLDEKIDECYSNGKVNTSCLGSYPPGNIYPYIEIWSGRIKPSKIGVEGTEQLRSYLNKNHEYRNDSKTYNRNISLLSMVQIFDYDYSEEDYNQLFENMVEKSLIYSKEQAEIIYDNNSASLKTKYVNTLKNQNEYTFLNIHGTTDSEWFGESIYLYSNEIESLEPSSMIFELASCSNGNFTAEDYMAGTYLFSGESLVVMANSVVSFISINDETLVNTGQLRLGLPIGEVYRHKSCDLVCHLFGDPTLRLRSIDLEDWPKLEVESLFVDFGTHPIGSETKVNYSIKNNGTKKLIINRPLGMGAKLDGDFIDGYIPFYYTNGSRSLYGDINIDPFSEENITLFFYLPEGLVIPGTYEGVFFEMSTNDPTKPWITINLKGEAI